MSRIGVFGGMGPSATVDFMEKLVRLTPATRDQEHLPIIVASLPHTHDRSSAILGRGRDPLPQLLAGIDFFNTVGVGVIAIPCNSSHHWYAQMQDRSTVPILHIAQVSVAAVPRVPQTHVAIFATRGALLSGFYQRALAEQGVGTWLPDPEDGQGEVDTCIREVKAGRFEAGGAALERACARAVAAGATALIMACTELPIAARYANTAGLALVDSSLELARASVAYALDRGWNRPGWDS
ncbi:amino acid racemase [uncultured Rhodoferax sp.]|uniref:aspartate/glutamate racemase family protein n=1 Tax=uncultured Rhodoferax sp. TaxID=223188 RepID=UPI0025E65DBC|nr:amino acid racemase [uncultured Rhodoferax sp.]